MTNFGAYGRVACLLAVALTSFLFGCNASATRDARIAFDHLTLCAARHDIDALATCNDGTDILVDDESVSLCDCWTELARMRPSDETPTIDGARVTVPLIYCHLDGTVYRGEAEMTKSTTGNWVLQRIRRTAFTVVAKSEYRVSESRGEN